MEMSEQEMDEAQFKLECRVLELHYGHGYGREAIAEIMRISRVEVDLLFDAAIDRCRGPYVV